MATASAPVDERAPLVITELVELEPPPPRGSNVPFSFAEHSDSCDPL